MAATASLEDLQAAKKSLKNFTVKYPKAFEALGGIINDHKMIGYKNICKMILGKTPEDLKA